MSAKLNIESQTAKHEKCMAIVDMIKLNRRYLLCAISDSQKPMMLLVYGREYFEEKIALRTKIQNRLICYYAKEVAKLSVEPFEVAMEIMKPNQSPIIHS